MAHPRVLSLAAIGLMLPGPLIAQNVSSMIVEATSAGRPAAGVEFVFMDGDRRRTLATTGASGLAVVEFSRAPLGAGDRASVFAVSCADGQTVQFSGAGAALPFLPGDCRRTRLGSILWFGTERLDVTLGDAPAMRATVATSIVQARSGLRAQLGPQLTLVFGDELDNIGLGYGGEALVGYDGTGGFGIGAGVGLARHDLEGLDESLWRWAIIAEPRYTFNHTGWRARPYVAGRLAYQVLDAEEGSGSSSTTERGWSYGAGVGVIVPFAFGMSAEIATHLGRLSVEGDENPALPGLPRDRSGLIWTLGAAVRF